MNQQSTQRSNTIQYLLVELFDIVSFFIFIVGLLLCIRFFLFNPFTVVGQSMEPTFHENDFIIIDKITPQHDAIVNAGDKILPSSWSAAVSRSLPGVKRGDILVFVPPGKDVPFIKRVI
jgi:signal peptidase I